jgi:DNA-binding NarL/FixJ family response regulator
MGEGPQLLIVDDHPLLREGLAMAAQAALPGLEVDTAGSIAEAEALIEAGASYRLAMLDLIMPDTQGFSGFLRLQAALGPTPILIVSGRDDPALVETARSLGAIGFVSKMLSRADLVAALGRVLQGETSFPAARTGTNAVVRARAGLDRLSGAQLRVMLALASGQSNKQIAADLGLSEATVKAHLSAGFRKLGIQNRAQAILAMQPLLAT